MPHTGPCCLNGVEEAKNWLRSLCTRAGPGWPRTSIRLRTIRVSARSAVSKPLSSPFRIRGWSPRKDMCHEEDMVTPELWPSCERPQLSSVLPAPSPYRVEVPAHSLGPYLSLSHNPSLASQCVQLATDDPIRG